MSPYEIQSIAIARDALIASTIADIIAGIAVLAVIAGSIVAYQTLRTILAQLRSAQWSTLLSFEQEMANRAQKFHELANQLSNPQSSVTQESINSAKENYFNAIDRLATLILNGQFSQKELKQDYQDMIKDTIRTYPTDFSVGTRYRSVVKLHNKWEDDK